jgi:glutamate-1-semialdehyde 2,1-aminomutase
VRREPGGITYTGRALASFPLFITANRGSPKWDAEGFEYLDYWLGHGAMLLGHAHPAGFDMVARQSADSFHAGGESPLAVEWGELVQSMVPSAKRVRFVVSGGEATQMAIRVARAYAGRDRILKFQATYHGWHDAVCLGVLPPYDVPFSLGVPKAIQETVTTFLRRLRELTAPKRVLLVFDEVVTGFRYARGGAQEYFGVTPDLTAAREGRGRWAAGRCRRREGRRHEGPGLASGSGVDPLPDGALPRNLELESRGGRRRHRDAQARAGHRRRGARQGPDAEARGSYPGTTPITARRVDRLLVGWGATASKIRKAILFEGVDLMRTEGFLSAAHGDDDIETTCRGLERALRRIRDEGSL